MHSQYLRRLFLDNDRSEGRYPVGGKPVVLSDISVPVFMVGTVTDHVAPWRSIYKLHHLTEAELTFVLTSGGHNVGIVSLPGHPHRQFQLLTRPAGDVSMAPDDWLVSVPVTAGSWWPAWHAWLTAHGRGTSTVAPPRMGTRTLPPLQDAPGRYVLEK